MASHTRKVSASNRRGLTPAQSRHGRGFMQAYGPVFADVYNRRWSAFAKQVAPLILDFYSATSIGRTNKSVLDLGCGTGQLALRFLQNGYRIVGIDGSEHMLRHANETHATSSMLVKRDLSREMSSISVWTIDSASSSPPSIPLIT